MRFIKRDEFDARQKVWSVSILSQSSGLYKKVSCVSSRIKCSKQKNNFEKLPSLFRLRVRMERREITKHVAQNKRERMRFAEKENRRARVSGPGEGTTKPTTVNSANSANCVIPKRVVDRVRTRRRWVGWCERREGGGKKQEKIAPRAAGDHKNERGGEGTTRREGGGREKDALLHVHTYARIHVYVARTRLSRVQRNTGNLFP